MTTSGDSDARWMRRPEGADPRDSDRMFDPEVAEQLQRERAVTHPEEVTDEQGTSVDTGHSNPSDRDDLDAPE